MKTLVALHGKAGSGKDTFADRLVDRHGFVKRGFADPLYEEVAAAFDVEVSWLRDRTRKEVPQLELAVVNCRDAGFFQVITHRLDDPNINGPRSPRWILQHWGTDYRRAQSDTYWLDQMAEFANGRLSDGVRGIVIPDCRFLNEGQWVCRNLGVILKLERAAVQAVSSHVSEIPLPADMIERVIFNNGSISYLHSVVDSTIRGAERIGALDG